MRRSGPTRGRKVYLTPEIDDKVDRYVADPLRGKPIYGGFSQLVEMLLVQFLAKIDQQERKPND